MTGSGPDSGDPFARHELHPLELVSVAWRALRAEPGRVVVPAVVIFALDAVEGTFFTELSVDHRGLESLAGSFVFAASTLGVIFYSGLLERLVGAVERNEQVQPVRQVLRTLPWFRLLAADLVLFVFGALAAVVAVLPGLIVDTLFALVGPLINLLDCSVPEALRRSVKLVWPHFALVFCFVTIPLGVEHEILVLVADLVPHENVGLVFVSNFVLGCTFGIGLGLTEVSLTEQLVRGTRGLDDGVRSDGVELPS